AEVGQFVLQALLIARDCLPIDTWCRPPFHPPKCAVQRLHVHVMQQRCEPRPLVPPCCLVHPHEIRRQGDPALRPALGALARNSLVLAPSLHAPRFLRRLHRYYEPVRLPASARRCAPVTPCAAPPSTTSSMAPAGSPRFRERPFEHDAVHDPGGATPS